MSVKNTQAVTLWWPQPHSAHADFPTQREASRSALSQAQRLKKLVQKADSFYLKPHNYYQRASHLFHQPGPQPIAACQAQYQLQDADASLYWLKLDPVQLIADRDTLVLVPAQQLEITEAESQALFSSFNQHFAQDGLQLIWGSATSWYLSLPQAIDLQTTPLAQAAYHSLQGLYPSGHASGYWRKLMNEVQMLFYTHPVNVKRREQGRAEINSLWLWGEGQIDQATLYPRAEAMVWSDDLYLQGLAQVTQAQVSPSPQNYQDWLPLRNQAEAHFIELNFPAQATQESVFATLEQQWMAGLLEDLAAGRIHSLFIDLGWPKGFLLEPKHLKRFWRWRLSLN